MPAPSLIQPPCTCSYNIAFPYWNTLGISLGSQPLPNKTIHYYVHEAVFNWTPKEGNNYIWNKTSLGLPQWASFWSGNNLHLIVTSLITCWLCIRTDGQKGKRSSKMRRPQDVETEQGSATDKVVKFDWIIKCDWITANKGTVRYKRGGYMKSNLAAWHQRHHCTGAQKPPCLMT